MPRVVSTSRIDVTFKAGEVEEARQILNRGSGDAHVDDPAQVQGAQAERVHASSSTGLRRTKQGGRGSASDGAAHKG